MTAAIPSLAEAAEHPLPPYLGRQLIAEFYDCPVHLLNDRDFIERAMNDAARDCGATIVNSVFHLFNPHGVSGAVIIAESHLTIHTWPEHGYAAVDVFTCGETVDPSDAVESLTKALQAGHTSSTEMNRGHTRTITRRATVA